MKTDLCLVLPCLGAGHEHSEILGKLRNTRLDRFCQKLRFLDSLRSNIVLNVNYIGANIVFSQN